MKIRDQEFYNYLSDDTKNKIEQIENHKILGASKHIEIFCNGLEDIIQSAESYEPLDNIKKYLNQLSNYFLISRGQASRSIYNNIKLIMGTILGDSVSELKSNTNLSIRKFKKNSEEDLQKILEYSVNEFYKYDSFVLFDYSSTVEKVIRKIANQRENKINVFIAESSSINGGLPYLNLANDDQIKCSFFPDSAVLYKLQAADCCLMGAETFYPDGTGFNTIGSDIVSILCRELNKPLYFLTQLNKLDIRRIEGISKEIVYIDYENENTNSNVDTKIPELVAVPQKNISAYITEKGVIPSNQLFKISMEYNEELMKNG
ncbi:hypothetical protein QP101_03285 [Aerococcus urinae]|uniref:hypothetical protein n=1 Tax=Aerococcus urinae TaxID=1376 RepID=UPI00254AEEE3|nr:hypothetical protein [Aerococcus urinae]MDK6371111.1 hypothetical protein [Aerococcus urinae]